MVMRYNKLYLSLRRMICFVLAFLLSLLIVGIVFLNTLSLNNTNGNIINQVLTSSDYCNILYQEIEGNAKLLTISTGLPMEVLEGVFQSEEVQAEVVSNIEATFLSRKYSPNTQIIRERLEQKIETYLNEKNIRVDTEISQNIDEYTALVTDEYSKSLDLPLIERIDGMKLDYRVFFRLIIGLCVVIGLLIISLYDKEKQWYQQLLYYFYNSTFTAAIMLAVLPLILLSKQLYNSLPITPSSLYRFTIEYIKVNLWTLIRFSILLGVLSIILLLIGRVFGIKLMKYKRQIN